MAIESHQARTIPQQTPLGRAPTAPPAARPGRVLAMLRLARPRHWVKTLAVVPLPLLYAPWTVAAARQLGWAVATFIVASSLTYVINDIADVRHDRLHVRKRYRPLAAGLVSVPAAWLFAGGLAALLAALVAEQSLRSTWPSLCYLVLNALYSTMLKHLPLVDIFVVATGFQLRLAQGAIAVGAGMSAWLALSVFALCLFLILGKRRHEITVTDESHRPALRGYTLRYIEHLLVFTAAIATICFFCYLKTDASLSRYAGPAVLTSAPFALFAVFQYLRLLIIHGDGGDPVHALLHDRPMVVNALLWALVLTTVAFASRYPAVLADLLAHVR
jgi:4-hydroxybenzoate polyprenyltransferase